MNPGDIPDSLPFGRIERAIVSALASRFERWVPSETLIAAAYAHDPAGGPDGDYNSVKQHCSNIRRKLEPYGFTIEGHSGAGRRLVHA